GITKIASNEVQYMDHAVAGLDVGRSYRCRVPRFGNGNVGYIRDVQLPVTHVFQPGFGGFAFVINRIVEYDPDVADRVVIGVVILPAEGVEYTEVDLRIVAELVLATEHVALEVFAPDGRVDIGQCLDGIQAEVV